MSYKSTSSKSKEDKSASLNVSNSKAARKAMMAAKQSKAIEKLDKMVEEVLETDLPQLCPFSLPPLPNSLSESGICSHGRHTHGHSMNPCHPHHESKMSTSQSFSHSREHQCCSGFSQHANGRHNRVHSNACEIL